jgi:hypothetical protein
VKRGWVYLLLFGLAMIFWGQLWLAPGGFLYRPNSDYSDLTITHWPNAFFVRDSLATWGQVPLWRHLILGGEPFAANPLSGLWYPPNVLFLFFPLTIGFNVLFVLHTVWAGWGGYRLAQSLKASWAGGLLAALIVMFTPKAIAHLASGHVGLYCAWAWLPWVMWTVRRLACRSSPRNVALVSVTTAMLILADVRLGFYGGMAAAGYWLLSLVFRSTSIKQLLDKTHIFAALGSVLLLGALVAVQMVPLAMVSGRLNRGGLALEESGIASLPPSYLIGLLVADHGGFQETMTYVGAVGLFLALVGLATWRDRERWWWLTVILVATIYSLGTNTPLYELLYRVLPPLGWLRGPARAWFLVVLAVAVLAARGVTDIVPKISRRPWLDRLTVGLVGVVLGGAIASVGQPLNIAAAVVIWSLAGMLVTLYAGGRLRWASFAGLVMVLAFADLFSVGLTLYRVRPAAEVLGEGAAVAAWLAEQPKFFRTYSPTYSIPHHTGAVYGIESVDGVDPFQLRDYVNFMRRATGVDIPGYSVTVPSFPEVAEGEDMLLANCDVMPDLRLLGLLNVRYLTSACPISGRGLVPLGVQTGVYLYRNEYVLPRAFVVDDKDVLVNPAVREARIVEWTPNYIQIEAEGPGLLVLSEVYDPDWRVYVNGRPTKIVLVEGILRGVYLDEVQCQVDWNYVPAGLWAGVLATAIGMMAVLILWGLEGRRVQS